MKTRKAHISLSLVALLLILSTLFGACGNKKTDEPKKEQTQTDEQGIPAGIDLALIKDGLANFEIVLPAEPSEEEEKIADTLRSKFKSAVDTVDANIVRADKYDAEKIEILIGQTGYPESDVMYENIGYGSATYRVVGHKLVIAAWIDDYYSNALLEFYTILRKEVDNGNLTVKGDTYYIAHVVPNISAIPLYTGGEFAYTQEAGTLTGSRADQITFCDTTKAHFDEYKAKLSDAGFKTVQENTIGQNYFITVSNGKKLVSAYHMANLSETRIIVENDREYAQAPSTDYETVCDTTLWQLGLEEERTDLVYRMNAYVIKLADGRFIVHDTGTRAASTYIYNYLRANTPEGEKIKIAAVIITHPHTDHMYGLLEMEENYTKDQLEIEAAYFNFGAKSMQTNYTDAKLAELWRNCENAAKAFGAEVYVARSGMKLEIANAVVEFLWTVDDYGTTIIEEYNDTSAISRITVNDQTILFLGDHTEAPSLISMSMYKEDLKSDMVTVAHHGMSGAEFEFYELVQPSIVFWPNRWYEEDFERNEKLRNMECVKHHYLAGDGDVVVTLETK